MQGQRTEASDRGGGVRSPFGHVYILLFLTVLMWGGGAVAGKLALRGIPNLAVGLLRFGFAAITLWAVFRREFPRWSTLTRSDRWLILGLGAFGGFLNSVLSKFAIRRFGPIASLGYGMIVGCGFLAPLVLVDRSWVALASASAVAWLALAYLTFATTLLAFFWWNVGIQRVGAGKTAIFSNLVPVFGVLLAWVVLGETLGAIQLGGAALAVAGVWVCQRTPKPRPPTISAPQS